MITQEQSILHHLKSKGPLTPLEALNLYGCLRLAAVVHSLKAKNHQIISNSVRRNGKSFAQYSYGKPSLPRLMENETLAKMKAWEMERQAP